jgi:hypothetical protein
MLSAVCLGPVKIGSVACCADPAVRLAAEDDVATEPAVAGIELAGAGAVGVVDVAAVVVLVGGALEHVDGSVDGGELALPVLLLGTKLAKSSSCGCPACPIGHAVSSADFGTAAFGPADARARASSSWRSARSAAALTAAWSIVLAWVSAS